ncbi:MAG: hypothetical protein WCG01_01450 [bacterium]
MMTTLAKQLSIFSMLILVNFSVFYAVNAGIKDTVMKGGLGEVGKNGFDTTGEPTDIRVTVAKILNRLLGFLGIIFVGLIMYAGFQWLTVGGDSKKIETAKSYLQNGVIGLIIILSAMMLADFVMGCVINVTGNSGGTFFGSMCGN